MASAETERVRKRYGTLLAAGADRTGLVEGVSTLLRENGCNIEPINMAAVRGEFALLVSFSGTPEQIENVEGALPKFRSDTGLAVLFHTPADTSACVAEPPATHDVWIYAFDATGIVSDVTKVLARHNINIVRLAGDLYRPQNSVTEFYTLVAAVVAPETVREADIRAELEAVGGPRGWDVDLQPHGRVDTSTLAESPSFPPKPFTQCIVPSDLSATNEVHEIRLGNIRAAIWAREAAAG